MINIVMSHIRRLKGAYFKSVAGLWQSVSLKKRGSSGIGCNPVMGRFSCKLPGKTAAGGQGTAYVNNWQALLATAESIIYVNPARRHSGASLVEVND